MKNFFFSFVLFILITSSCSAQKSDWLRTDKKEFEKLFPLFDTIIHKPGWYESLSRKPEDALPDTLSVGIWKGNLKAGGWWGTNELTLRITQTSPFIKGFLFFVNLSTDAGPDTTGGEIRGIKKDDHYLLVWQILPPRDIMFYLDGSCFKERRYGAIESFIGNFVAEHDWPFTKGNFYLQKY